MKPCSLAIHEMQINGYRHFESQKHIKEHKINTIGSWRYIEVLWSELIGLCKKLNIITLLPVIQSLRQTVHSDVQFMNESFFWTGSF